MSIDGALCDDVIAIEKGWMQLLPKLDASGRQLMYLEPARHDKEGYTSESLVSYICSYPCFVDSKKSHFFLMHLITVDRSFVLLGMLLKWHVVPTKTLAVVWFNWFGERILQFGTMTSTFTGESTTLSRPAGLVDSIAFTASPKQNSSFIYSAQSSLHCRVKRVELELSGTATSLGVAFSRFYRNMELQAIWSQQSWVVRFS